MRIETYSGTPTQRTLYDDFLRRKPETLLYQTSAYMALLEELLDAQNLTQLVWSEQGTLLGALPLMRRDGPWGGVINSLPYYGSNGAIIAETPSVADMLHNRFREVAQAPDIAASTVVENPLDPEGFTRFAAPLEEERVGQFTPLPKGNDITGALMARFHGKTRNMVRKTQKLGIATRTDPGAMDFLLHVHTQNISEIGGLAKTPAFFDLVQKHFFAPRDYQIYVATLDGVDIAAMLVFFWNRTVEYYTPVVVKDYRSCQPLSALIFQAMCDAADAGFTWWNWGGTWLSQSGVYQFKSRWGTKDIPYRYKIDIRNKKLLDATPHQLLEHYPGFYTVPFSQLRSAPTP